MFRINQGANVLHYVIVTTTKLYCDYISANYWSAFDDFNQVFHSDYLLER
ncbi:hypothetical protein YEEN111655_19475 [Yersinia entomophaga]